MLTDYVSVTSRFETRALDVFLEYQWDFGKKADGTLNDKTYAQLPKNMKVDLLYCTSSIWCMGCISCC
jgi:hypothetical protein